MLGIRLGASGLPRQYALISVFHIGYAEIWTVDPPAFR
jgi:hypothetical protein